MTPNRGLIINPAEMWPPRSQWDSAEPLTDSGTGTQLLLNMRRHTDAELRRVSAPALCALLPRRPEIADRRGDSLMLFSAAGGVNMRLEGAVLPDGSFEASPTDLCVLPAALREAASAGEFLVLRLADGRLFFLLWHADLQSYSVLGELPAAGAVRAEATEEKTLSAMVDATTFRHTLTDPRTGFDKADTAAMGAAVEEAYTRLRAFAAAEGRRVAPVVVRVAARLWDGQLLSVSAPMVVGCGWQEGGRVELPLAGTAGAWTGTSEGSVSARAYKIGVSVEGGTEGGWADVIRSYEVWVSDEAPQPPKGRATAAYNTSMPGKALVFTAQTDGELALTTLLGGRMRRVARMSVGAPAIVGRADHAPLQRLPTNVQPLAGLRARAILGHAGFLHLGGVSRRCPLPQFPRGDGEASVVWRVAVRIATLGGDKWVCSAGRAQGSALFSAPLLWYGSSDAEEMVVSVCDSEGQWREASFELRPAEWDEDCAYWLDPDLRGMMLEEVDAPRSIVESVVWVESAREVAGSVRGNPLVEASRTADVGGIVRLLAAQPVGGGAFTRQFIYCFTPEGVSALTHAPDGTHTNCRRIAANRLGERQRVAAGATGVWALDCEGELILLRDARAEVKLRGLSAYDSIVWAAPFDELHINASAAGRHTLALDCATGCISRRTARPAEPIAGSGGRPLYAEAFGDAWCVNMLEPPTGSTIGVECEWISSEFESPVEGAAELPSGPTSSLSPIQRRGARFCLRAPTFSFAPEGVCLRP